MLFNKDLKNKEEEDEIEEGNSKELTEQDYIQINKDISKALVKMKEEKDNDSNESPEESEKELANFDIDFFSESSNSFSVDNNSDFSDNSIKSANVEMNRNNLSLESNNSSKNKNNNEFKNNNKINKLENKQIEESFKNSSSSNIKGLSNIVKNTTFNKKNSFKSMKNERKHSGINSYHGDSLNNSFTPKSYSNYINNNNFPNSNINKALYLNNIANASYNNLNNLDNQVNKMNNYINNINNLNPQEKIPHFVNNNLNSINNINNMSSINNYNLIPNKDKEYFFPNNINNFNNSFINNRSNLYLNNNINNNIINPNNNNNNIYNNIKKIFNITMPNNNINLNNINCNNLNIFNCSMSEGSAQKFQLNKENVDSPKNIIHIENILKSKDKRTTLIIRNIPNRYTISLLINELNQNYYRKYDVVYLPQDYINNSNLGFGFINFLEHMYLIMFYEEFVGKKWNCFNSNKRCQLAYSKYQGKNELIKYIHKKLGISSHYNNNENLKKSFYINNEDKYPRPLIEIPIKYYKSFLNYYPFSLCHIKDDKFFIVDKYYNF